MHGSSDTYLWVNYYIFFFNRECISGRWGKLSFPTQYESSSVHNNISGGDIYDFLALMCNFMETVYRPLDNRLRIHQVLGSLKLIEVGKNPSCS